ncbi:MAG: putative Ig domain-containing protein, partial [Candidatus Binatia bacterium]
TTPYSYSASSLPPGLSINATTGAIFGTPTTSGNYSPFVTVHDVNNLSVSKTLSLTVNPGVTPAPSISSVSPASPIGSNSAQPFTIYGSNFVAGCNVTLRTGGTPYANRAQSSFSSTAITINPNFSTTGATWSVEVINPDGKSSGQYYFTVRPG